MKISFSQCKTFPRFQLFNQFQTTRPLSWAKLFSRPAPPRIKNTKSNKGENKKSNEGDKPSDKTTNATKSTETKKQSKIAERKAMFEVKKKDPQTERKNEGQTKEISTELMPKNYKISLLGSHLKIKESEIREVCTKHFCILYGINYLSFFTLSLLHHAKLYFSLSNYSIQYSNKFIWL